MDADSSNQEVKSYPQIQPKEMEKELSNPQPAVSDVPVDLQVTQEKKSDKKSFNLFFISFFVLVVLGILAFIYRDYLLSFLPLRENIGKPLSKNGDKLSTYAFVNCDDLRDVIEEGNTLYLACLGGVIVLNKDTGEVLSQITMPDGLGDSTTTSLAKKGNTLFIGTQDGFTEFDLKSRRAKKISVSEGLVNGANIELALDGNNLWVGTFDGISLYDINSGKILNYKKEIFPNLKAAGIIDIGVLNSTVYATASAGGLAVFRDGVWKNFQASDFGVENRVDFFNSPVLAGGKLFLSNGTNVWWTDEKTLDSWKKIDGVLETIKGELSDFERIEIIGSDQGKVFVHGTINGSLTVLDSQTLLVERTPRPAVGEPFVLSKYEILKMDGEKIWLKTTHKSNLLGENIILIEYDAQNLSFGKEIKVNRPLAFYQTLAAINDRPIVSATLAENKTKLFEFDTKKNIFRPWVDVFDTSNYLANPGVPIINTSKFFIWSQECGMGCSEPTFTVYDYSSGMQKYVEIDSSLKNKFLRVSSPDDYVSPISLAWEDNLGKFVFSNDTEWYYLYDISSDSWEEVTTFPEGGVEYPRDNKFFCNLNFTFENNVFVSKDSCFNPIESEKFRWSVVDGKLIEESKATGQKQMVSLKASPQVYSPFGWEDKQIVNKVVNSNGKLWLATTRGLVKYDPETKETTLFDASKYLLRNNVYDVLITNQNYVWAISHWGGLVGFTTD